MKDAYPAGIELIEKGRCPAGAVSPMACMFCPCGHMLECHYPYDCETAGCSHLAAYENDLLPELIEDLGPICGLCGCSEFDPCEGDCAWSERYMKRDCAICTQCEEKALTLELNLGALEIWRRNVFNEDFSIGR